MTTYNEANMNNKYNPAERLGIRPDTAARKAAEQLLFHCSGDPRSAILHLRALIVEQAESYHEQGEYDDIETPNEQLANALETLAGDLNMSVVVFEESGQ